MVSTFLLSNLLLTGSNEKGEKSRIIDGSIFVRLVIVHHHCWFWLVFTKHHCESSREGYLGHPQSPRQERSPDSYPGEATVVISRLVIVSETDQQPAEIQIGKSVFERN